MFFSRIVFTVCLLSMVACGGGGGSSADTSSEPTFESAVIVQAAVGDGVGARQEMLMLGDRNSGRLQKVADLLAGFQQPQFVLAPNGLAVAYVSGSIENNRWGLSVAILSGSHAETRALGFISGFSIESEIFWSPAAKWLVYRDVAPGGYQWRLADVNGQQNILLNQVGETVVGSSWSEDDRYFYYMVSDPETDSQTVWLFDTVMPSLSKITSGGISAIESSPDGAYLILSFSGVGPGQTKYYRRSSGEIRDLTPSSISQVVWSSNPHVGIAGESWFDLDSGMVKGSTPTGDSSENSLSHDKNYFLSWGPGGPSHLVRMRDGLVTELHAFSNTAGPSFVVWSPIESKAIFVVYEVAGEPQYHLWRLDAEAGILEKISATQYVDPVWQMAWPNRDYVILSLFQSRSIQKVNVSDGALRPIGDIDWRWPWIFKDDSFWLDSAGEIVWILTTDPRYVTTTSADDRVLVGQKINEGTINAYSKWRGRTVNARWLQTLPVR